MTRAGQHRRGVVLNTISWLPVAAGGAWVVLLAQVTSVEAITVLPAWKTPELIFEQPGWSGRMTGQDRFLDYDHFGVPGVAVPVRPGGAGSAIWMKPPSGDWNIGIANGAFASHASIVFDRSERPIEASIATGAPNLRVSRAEVLGFSTEVVAPGNTATLYTSPAVDPLGRLAVAYGDQFDQVQVVYDLDGNDAFDDDGGMPFVLSIGAQTSRPSLAFDPQARPMVAYVNGFTGSVEVDIFQPGVGFGSDATPDADLPAVDFVSLAVNPMTGLPAVAYNDRDNNRLKYAWFDGDDWNAEIVHTQPSGNDASDMSVSLAFDPADGLPAIAFTGDTSNNRNVLRFAWFDGNQWNVQTVDDRANIAVEAVSLAFNEDFGTGFGDGLAGIAYLNGEQVHYVMDPPAIVPEPVSGLLVLVLIGAAATGRRGGA